MLTDESKLSKLTWLNSVSETFYFRSTHRHVEPKLHVIQEICDLAYFCSWPFNLIVTRIIQCVFPVDYTISCVSEEVKMRRHLFILSMKLLEIHGEE
jgi:hypothetical protein